MKVRLTSFPVSTGRKNFKVWNLIILYIFINTMRTFSWLKFDNDMMKGNLKENWGSFEVNQDSV